MKSAGRRSAASTTLATISASGAAPTAGAGLSARRPKPSFRAQTKFARMICTTVPPPCAPAASRRAAAVAITPRYRWNRSRQSRPVSIASGSSSFKVAYPIWQVARSRPSTMQNRTLCLQCWRSGSVCSSKMKAMAVCPVNSRARKVSMASAADRTPRGTLKMFNAGRTAEFHCATGLLGRAAMSDRRDHDFSDIGDCCPRRWMPKPRPAR